LYLYQTGFLHSKMMVCDDSVVTCGSTNVDSRSFENNFEANAFIYDEGVVIRLRNVFLRDQENAVLLSDLPQRIHPSFKKRLWESLIRLLSPLL
jgi:cardiolipin synthase